jgi:molecular chaperone GrpE
MQNTENYTPDENLENETVTNETDIKAENNAVIDETIEVKTQKDDEARIAELNDRYLRLYSEFDNYRKRTTKEKIDIIRTAGEDVLKSILPVIDDFERAIKANEKVEDIVAIREGIQLIYNKLKNNTFQKGLTPFDSIGIAFNPDTMEAITHIPALEDSQKGIVIDEVEKGYKLGDKVIRFARVVVGQ